MDSPLCCNICGSSQLLPLRERSDRVRVLKCSQCGMGVVETHPADLMSLYRDEYYSHQGNTGHGYSDYGFTAEHGLAWAVSLIRRLVPSGRILDIGCADGHLLKQLRSSHECYGIEMNEGMAALCRTSGIQVVASDIFDPAVLESYKGYFDVVSAIALFEHVSDMKKAVGIALNLLNENGLLLFEVPLIAAQHPSETWFSSSLEHIYYPDEGSLRYLFETVFQLPLVGREIVIADYASTYIGVVPRNPEHGEKLNREFHRLVAGPVAELTAEERNFRFLLDLVHAANTTPENLSILRQTEPASINPYLLQRLVDLWVRDQNRLTATAAHLEAVRSAQDWHEAECRRRDAIISDLQNNLRERDARLTDLQCSIAGLDTRISDLQSQVSGLGACRK